MNFRAGIKLWTFQKILAKIVASTEKQVNIFCSFQNVSSRVKFYLDLKLKNMICDFKAGIKFQTLFQKKIQAKTMLSTKFK